MLLAFYLLYDDVLLEGRRCAVRRSMRVPLGRARRRRPHGANGRRVPFVVFILNASITFL